MLGKANKRKNIILKPVILDFVANKSSIRKNGSHFIIKIKDFKSIIIGDIKKIHLYDK